MKWHGFAVVMIVVGAVSAVRPCAEIRDTAGSAARPIIIIPGITATELTCDGQLVWPPLQSSISAKDFSDVLSRVAIAVDRLQLLACDERGASRVPIAPVRMTPRAAPATGRLGVGDFYAPLARALADAFGRQSVYFFGYDWRLDNYATAVELDRFIRAIRQETGARGVDIVAHSMGGIVTAAYLTRYGGQHCVDHAVFLGTPFNGAARALSALAGTDVSMISFMAPDLRALQEKKTTSVYQLMGGIDYTIAAVSRTFPSVYQLLPERERAELTLLRGPSGALSATAQARCGSAWGRSTARELSGVLRGVRARALVGTGFPTVGTARIVRVGDTGIAVETTTRDGDGTVPIDSALGGGTLAAGAYRFRVKHEALATDPGCIQAIIAELSGR